MSTLEHPDISDCSMEGVLLALSNPVRLAVVRRLAAGEQMTCSSALQGVPKSSASHHWRTMRECGLLREQRQGRQIHMSLRREELDERFPGLLDAVLRVPASPATESDEPVLDVAR